MATYDDQLQKDSGTEDVAQRHYDREFAGIVNNLHDAETQAPHSNNSTVASNAYDKNSAGAAGLKAAESLNNQVNRFDQVGKGYNPAPSTGSGRVASWLRSKSAKKWGTGVLISLVLGGGGFSLFNVASGPFQFIHAAEVLSSLFQNDKDMMNNRGGQLIRFKPNQKSEKKNLSWQGNVIANYYEKKLKATGITPGYENGRIKTLTLDLNKSEGELAAQKLREMGVEAETLKPNSKGIVTINVDKNVGLGSARYRRQVISGMVGVLDLNGISSAMASRMLKARAGVDFHPLTNVARAADEKLADYYKKLQDEQEQRIKEGVEPPAKTVSVDGNDDTNDPAAAADNTTANGAADEANSILGDANKPGATIPEKTAAIKGKLTRGVGITGYLATICGVQQLGNAVTGLRYANIVLPLIRTAMEAITIGSQIKSGVDFNAEQLGAFDGQFYDKKTKTSWTDARSVQAALGQKPTGPDMPAGSKPGNVSKPTFFATIDSIVGALPGGNTFCKAVSTTTGGWLLTAAGIGLTATGPVKALLDVASEVGQTVLSNAFLDDLIKWVVGDQISTAVSGAERGNYLAYGARLAANDVAISHGGRALSKNESKVLAMESRQAEASKQQSFYARYFDLHHTNSLASRFLFETPAFTSPVAAFDSIGRLPGNIASALALPFKGIFTGQAHATTIEDTGYDFGFPQYGFSMDEIDNPAYENPYENAAIVEPRLAELNDKYGACFNTTVDPETFRLSTTQAKAYDQIDDKCRTTSNEELTRYRFYLADLTTAKTMMCYEGLDEDVCQELGFGAPSESGAASTGIDMAKLYDDSSAIACPPPTRDMGVQDGYADGRLVRIKLCALPNLPSSSGESNNKYGIADGQGQALVNARVAGAYYAMVEAAKKEGVELSANSSFRTMTHQRELCPCDGVTVAQPGHSNHQMGLAIDFGVPHTGNAISRNDTWFNWLSENAGTYGIKNYPREAWHWSPTGS